MPEDIRNKRKNHAKYVAIRALLILFDIIAVNAAYYLAILIRFYVANEFHKVAGQYMNAFFQFAPYYTISCIIVFFGFRLYSGMWKYAGINDLNRILTANLVTAVIQVAGSWLFVRRMPISYYCIGAVIQFCLIAVSRFSYRVLIIESKKLSNGKNGAALRAMIVGSGETSRMVLKQLERENLAHPVCVLNYKDNGIAGMLNGVPVVSGLDNLQHALKKYRVNFVIIADTLMTAEVRDRIKEQCKAEEIEVQDVSGYFQNQGGNITLKKLAEYTSGAVEIVIDGSSQTFTDGEQALMNVTGNYAVKSVSAKGNKLVIELQKNTVVLNDVNETWVQKQEQETGEKISFF